MGFGVWGLRFGVWGLGFGVWGLGFGVSSAMHTPATWLNGKYDRMRSCSPARSPKAVKCDK